jgi:2-amino-4-hydroxy-6-hydroxymethyldihydropteridine diphosphokinase
MHEHRAWFSLGSNIDPERNLPRCVEMLARRVRLLGISSVWQSPPADGSPQPDYLNAVVLAATDFTPEQLLTEVIAPIENSLGRDRSGGKFSPRTIDIDLLLYDRRVGEYAGRRLPHPDILLRPFVALPLADLSPQETHPETGDSFSVIAARFSGAGLRRRDDLHLFPAPPPSPGDG